MACIAKPCDTQSGIINTRGGCTWLPYITIVRLKPTEKVHYIFQETTVAPVFVDGRYLWQSGILGQPLPIPEPGDLSYGLSAQSRALSRGLRSGDTLRVVQTIDFEINITDRKRIDRDYRYYKAKDYCGNWQVVRDSIAIELDHTGFLNVCEGRSRIVNAFDLSVVSPYVSHEWQLAQLQTRGEFEACNFNLAPNIFPDPITQDIVAGFTLSRGGTDRPNGLLESRNRFWWDGNVDNYPYSSLGNTGTYYGTEDLTQFWYEIGLYLFQGAEVVSITEAIGVDLIVPVEIPPRVVDNVSLNPICGLEPSCELEFQVFREENDPSYLTQAECIAAGGTACVPVQFVCSSNSQYVRTIWVDDPVNS